MDVLRQAAHRRPGAAAVVGSERPGADLTYAELDRDADRLAGWLHGRTDEGGVVAMRLPIGPLALALIHGAWRAGRVLAPLGLGWTDREVEEALRAVGGPSTVIDESTDLGAALDHPPDGRGGGHSPEEGDVRVVLCTSGTGGRPRPVRITEANLAASVRAATPRLGLGPEDRWLAALSLAHVGGFVLAYRAAALGASIVPLPRFDAGAVATLIDAGRVTHVSLVPVMLHRLIEARGEHPAPEELRCVLLGGAACPPPLFDRAIALGYPLAPTYGLTEATSQVATQSPDRARRKPGTVGRPLEGIRLRIDTLPGVDRTGMGEILVAGPTVSKDCLGEDGWLHTGDLGTIDEDGDLRVEGRLSDAIVTGGVTVHPAEIEAVLATHPAVAEVAVTGVPDEEWGEVVGVVVRPRQADRPPELAELLAFSRTRLSASKRPRSLRVVDALPRNRNGKVDRRKLGLLWNEP